MTTAPSEVFHVNPDTGRPNVCRDAAACRFGGADFHYESRHDAEVAWRARQLERGIIAYRSVMQVREREAAESSFEAVARRARGGAKKMSLGVLRSLATRNLSRYLLNFLGVLVSYAIVSGRWLREDWIRRLLPALAAVVLVALLAWFAVRIWRGSRHTVRTIRKRRVVRRATR